MKIHIHVVISGRVQGVWYRANTKKTAEQLGLTGWVKNTTDGDVEAVFEGDESKLKQMTAWCLIGPPRAKVSNVKIIEKRIDCEFSDFRILNG